MKDNKIVKSPETQLMLRVRSVYCHIETSKNTVHQAQEEFKPMLTPCLQDLVQMAITYKNPRDQLLINHLRRLLIDYTKVLEKLKNPKKITNKTVQSQRKS